MDQKLRAADAASPALSALDLAARIDAGTIAPLDVVDLCADAIARREADIGAFAALDVAAARRAAADPALRLAPLRGLPVGIKDIFDTADFPTQYGSPIYTGHRPRADAALVALVRRAGGLLLGKTVTSELASLEPMRRVIHTTWRTRRGARPLARRLR